MNGLRVAFVAGLSEKKLTQKIAPLAGLEAVSAIDVYRREPFSLGEKTRWVPMRLPGGRVAGELEKCLRLILAARRYDLIIGCFQTYHGLWAWLAGALSGVPVIQMVITDVDWNRERPLARFPMLRADACALRGDVSLRKLRTLGFQGPAAVIHNPIEPPERTSAKDVPKRYDCIAAGNEAVEKDYPLMLRVFAGVKQRRGTFSAILCGRGFERLAPQIRSLGLEGDLHFPGYLGGEELDEAYLSSRMHVMTSSVEGLPMVVVEAMSHGLPVVVPGVGELSWLARDGRDGVVLSSRNETGFIDAICGLLDDEARREAMGESARQRFAELLPEFGIDAISGRWLELLGSLGLATSVSPEGNGAHKAG